MAIDIDTIANEPAEASNANGTVKRHSLAEMIEADRYERSKTAMSSKTMSVFARGNTRCVPPGTV